MKYKILALFLIASFCLADVVSFPSPAGYVTDSAQILSPADESTIVAMAEELEKKTTAQLVVVTVETTQPETIEGYAVRLFEKWGIGQKGKDNGILLLVASSDRKVRIETGYGIEGILPDATCKIIIEKEIIPYFKKGEYSQGILYGAAAIVAGVANEYNVEVAGSSRGIYREDKLFSISEILTSLYAIFFVIIWILGFLGFLGKKRRRRYSGGFWGFGGGGGFSGGFGGGRSGGGGASGSW